jgi:ABC-type uncharacterized transport system ATPase component
MLGIEALEKARAIQEINVSITERELVVVIGANSAEKSTLLDIGGR